MVSIYYSIESSSGFPLVGPAVLGALLLYIGVANAYSTLGLTWDCGAPADEVVSRILSTFSHSAFVLTEVDQVNRRATLLPGKTKHLRWGERLAISVQPTSEKSSGVSLKRVWTLVHPAWFWVTTRSDFQEAAVLVESTIRGFGGATLSEGAGSHQPSKA